MIKARLKGLTIDLEVMELLFPGDPGVAKDDVGQYFWGTNLENAAADGRDVSAIARLMLDHMCGIAKIKIKAFRGLEIALWEGYKPTFTGRIASVLPSLNTANHDIDPKQAERWLSLHTDHRVARVLRLHAGLERDPSWFDMYKIVETIRGDVGDTRVEKWMGKIELSTFNESANRAEISGTGARHAEIKGRPSGRSMTSDVACKFVRDLTAQWLDDKG
jgi:hypothetical protein